MLSTAALVLVTGSVVAMLVAAENRRAEEFSPDRQSSSRPHPPKASTRDTSHAEDTR